MRLIIQRIFLIRGQIGFCTIGTFTCPFHLYSITIRKSTPSFPSLS